MQDWLVGIVGSDLAPLASILLSALIVVALAVLALSLMRRAMRGGIGFRHTEGPRIEIVDVTSVDPKRKLVLVRRDQVEHLLLIGGGNDLVIEARIGRPAPPPPRRAEAPFTDPAPDAFPRAAPLPQPRQNASVSPAYPNRSPTNAAGRPQAAPEPRTEPRTEALRELSPAVIPVAAPPEAEVEVAPPAPRTPAAPLVRPGRVEPSFPFAEADKSAERPTPPVQPAERPQSATVPVQERRTPPMERPVARATPEVQVERRSMATPTVPVQGLRAEPPAAARDTGPSIDEPSMERPRAETTAPRVEPSPPPTPAAPPVSTAPERREADEPQAVEERAPLTVRSFASAIGEHRRPVPAPSVPPVAPPVAAAPNPPRPPEPQKAEIRPSAPQSMESGDDDLARLLSRELGTDEETNDRPATPPAAPDTSRTAARPAEEPGSDREKDAPRELTIEEEMERLMRDFAAHTTDRR